MHSFKSDDEFKAFLQDNILVSSEACELLGISRSRLSRLISDKTIVPFKKMGNVSLFLKSDLESSKPDLEERRRKFRPYDED